MSRVFASISMLSLLLAAVLLLGGGSTSGSPIGHAFKLADVRPAKLAAACSGVQVTGAHQGCLVFTQIVCRSGSATDGDQIVAEGSLPGTSGATIRVTDSQTRFSTTVYGTTVILIGGPPRTIDLQRGAELDVDVGQSGTPGAAHLKGWITCS